MTDNSPLRLTPAPSPDPNALRQWTIRQTQDLQRILQGLKDQIDNISVTTDAAAVGSQITALEQSQIAFQQAQSAQSGALSDAISALNVQIENAVGLTDQERFEIGLATRTDEIFGSSGRLRAEALQWSQLAAEEALAARIEGYNNGAAIRVTQGIISSERETVATQLQQVQANYVAADAVIAANVTAEQQARIDGDNALAADISTVSTTVAGNTASVQVLQSSVDGLGAQWGVTVNANGQVLGTVQLDGSQQGSVFAVIVDKFLVARPDGTGQAEVFAIGNINGSPAVGIKGNLLIDGSVLARHLAASSVTADKIDVTTLSAIAADVGTITAGRIRDVEDDYRFDVAAGRIYRTDGTFDINLKAKTFKIEV